MNSRRLLTRLSALIIALALLSACQTQQLAPGHSEAAFEDLARALLAQAPAGQKIAIRPFRPRESPIPLADANRFNHSLEQAIREHYPGRFRFVPREALQKIAAEADEFGQIADFTRFVQRQQADILIFGQLELMNDQVLLTYRSANPATGRLLARSPSRTLDYRLPAAEALPMAPALELLADKLAAERLAIAELYEGGLFFEETGIQTPLGRYLMQRLDTLVRQRLGRFPEHNAADYLEAEKGRALKSRGFILSGQYWAFGETLELRARLQGEDEERVHSVRIAKDSLPPRLRDTAEPPRLAPAKEDNLGPNPLHLSSDRGRRPLYRIGEQMELRLSAEADGYLYCFNAYYRNGRAQISRIFPNRYHEAAFISAERTLKLPNEAMDFVFRLYPPAGPEYVYCYLYDRDISHQLPADIAKKDLEPLSLGSVDALDQVMRALPGVRINRATLALTVEERTHTTERAPD